jgi:hypothetical protein
LRALQDGRDVIALALAAGVDGLLHARDGMLGQKLQDANVLTRPRQGAVLLLQSLAQRGEHRRQLPLFVDVGVVQGRRLASQRHQVMPRLEHLHALLVRA